MAFLSSTSLTTLSFGQDADSVVFEFDFDSFSARMKAMSATPYVATTFTLPDNYKGFDYDAYRRIQFKRGRGKWDGTGIGYQVQAFHLGWLFAEPVKTYEIIDGIAHPLSFSSNDFDYHDTAVQAAVESEDFPGIAGIRINYPLNQVDSVDELVSFLGASYFRALGRDNVYGLSARGLLMNSWLEGPEEFPRFSEFYMERPNAGAPMVMYAALESQSVTGAYRIEITPASESTQETVMDITARLYFRADVAELGIAPLTSMFLYAETNRAGFDDYRPQVHDSNGLLVQRASGEVMWRALNNTEQLGNSYFWDDNPQAFGLYQRGRDFETYQDAGAHYERRPSARIEPVGQWGQGSVRLIEIPSTLEADDNVVAFWVPAEPVLAGQEREFRYRLIWGDLNPGDNPAIAYVAETRAGQGGVSGVANAENLRKFVIDFKGGDLGEWPTELPPDVLANVTNGHIQTSTLSEVPANGVWRLVLDVVVDAAGPLELKAYLVGEGRALTETWLYQWRPSA